MPRYVILDHDHPSRHWDFMLESGGVLRTWRLLAEPTAGGPIAAEPLGDHRIAYLDYEGPLSGDRGGSSRAGRRCPLQGSSSRRFPARSGRSFPFGPAG